MFPTYYGAVLDEDHKAYLRPETAQGIFLDYKSILDTMRVKLPFGIAQVGKAFRNEVTPRNFIFRSREFEQMEMEWFCHEDDSAMWYEFWKDQRMRWWRSLGIDETNLRFRDHDADELAHYSKMCVDVEYRYPFTAPGFGELEGIAHRGCFDLTQHQEHAKQKLEYFDQDRNVRYIPNVIEPASGLTRGVLVLLCEAYTPDDSRPSKVYMKFHPRMAPIKAGIFPLVNKDGMPEIARNLYMDLRHRHVIQLDVKQNIGKRYARMDEAGTPFCFTIDGETPGTQSVTVRHRDTLAQDRIAIDKVGKFMDEKIGGNGEGVD
jgi:glycyl-tRNA synthetase